VQNRTAPEDRGVAFLPILTLLCFAFAMVGATFPLHAAKLRPLAGADPPHFNLRATTDTDFSLVSVRGHRVLVHFFATWCEVCREELPSLNRLAERANGNVKVVAISVSEPDRRVRRFVETTPVKFPVLLDHDGTTAKAWKVSTLPTTFLLDTSLHPRLVVDTDFAWDSLDLARLDEMLGSEPRNSPAAKIETTTTSTLKGGS
jgi:peroxiredoxin